MRTNKIVLVAFAVFALASNASAANKTHVTDMLGAGNGSIEISYETLDLNLPVTYVSAKGATVVYENKTIQSQLNVAFHRGFTDRFDMSILFPVLVSKSQAIDSASGANKYNSASKYEGEGDVYFRAKYLLFDKLYERISWNVAGIYSPANAPSDSPVAQITTNGVVTTVGKAGQSGKGYLATSFVSTVSIQTGVGDVYFTVQYDNNREKVTAGVVSKVGNFTSGTVGIEKMLGDKTTFSPYAKYTMQVAGYNGTVIFSESSKYDLGLNVIYDISKNASVAVGAVYNLRGEQFETSAIGDKSSYSGNGYTLLLSTMFFF